MTTKRTDANNSARKPLPPAGGSSPPADGIADPASPGRLVAGADDAAGPARIDLLAVTAAQAAKVLSAMGVGTVTEELIRRHIAAGALVISDTDGRGVRINLVHYVAWLNLPADPAGQTMGKGGHAA